MTVTCIHLRYKVIESRGYIFFSAIMNFDTAPNLTVLENARPQVKTDSPLHSFVDPRIRIKERVIQNPKSEINTEPFVQTATITAQPRTVQIPVQPSRFIPGVIKFLLLVPVLFTTLYTRSYTGEYQLFITTKLVYVMYAVFGSVTLSLVFFWQKPLKSVLLSMGIVSLLYVVHALRLDSSMAGFDHNLLTVLFSRTFQPVNFFFFGIGSAISFLVLWLIHCNQTETVTEVY